LIIIFWSPSREGKTAQSMSILANAMRIHYGLTVYTFHNYKKIVSLLNTRFKNRREYIFLDCGNHMDDTVRKLFQIADTVVVTFPQQKSVISTYFQEHHRIFGNIFYLFCNSYRNLLDSEKMCRYIWRLKEEEIGVLPFHCRFEQYYEKNLGYFYQKKIAEKKNFGEEEEFDNQICKITLKLLKMNCLFS
jgi:hypothetical protein